VLVCLWNHLIHRHVFFWKPFIASWPVIWALDSVVFISATLSALAILFAIKRKEILWPLLAIILCVFTIKSAVSLIQEELSEVDEFGRK